jgi:hypothetical protein
MKRSAPPPTTSTTEIKPSAHRPRFSINPQPPPPSIRARLSTSHSAPNQKYPPRPPLAPRPGTPAISRSNQLHPFATTIFTRYTSHARNLGLALRATGPPLHPRYCAGGSSPALPSARTAPRLAEIATTNAHRFLSSRTRPPPPHATSSAAYLPPITPHPFACIQLPSRTAPQRAPIRGPKPEGRNARTPIKPHQRHSVRSHNRHPTSPIVQ